MEQSYPATVYICNLVNAICTDAQVQPLPEYRFQVKANEIEVVLQFSRAEIDDFTAALERNHESAEFFTLENRIKFRIYVALGREGLLDELEISRELIDEKGDWHKSIQTNVTFEEDFARTLCEGLRLLNGMLTALSSNMDVEVPEIDNDEENIRYLIKYYEENGHLSSRGAELKSLSYLKGAAICVIATIEREKHKSSIVRIRKAFDRKIYAIVEELRKEPFQSIPVPECAREFLTQQGDTGARGSVVPERDVIKSTSTDRLNELLDELDRGLKKRRNGAWQTLKSDNPDRCSQAANSMVEILDHVIRQVCKDTTLNDFLNDKFGSHEGTKWVPATLKWVSETKSNLHRVKHHTDYQSAKLTEALMKNAENIMLLILNSLSEDRVLIPDAPAADA